MPKVSRRGRSKSRRPIAPEDLLKFQFVADPRISPDGSRVLFAKRHIGDKNNYVTNLWVVAADGGQARQFTSGETDGHGRWSPDGSTIAFISGRDKPNPQIYTLPADGGEAVKLTDFPDGTIAGFSWSPDGSMLAVQYRETEAEWTEAAKKEREENGGSIPARVIDDMYYRLDGDGYFNDKRFGLYIVDVATGKHRLLYDRDRIGWFSYDWSPNSKELAIATHLGKEPLLKFWKWDIVRVDVKSRKVTKLSELPDGVKSAVRYSPDGKRLAFSGCRGKEIWGVHNSYLFVCDLNGRQLQNLTGDTDYCLSAITLSDSAEAAFEENFQWTPDGRHLLMQIGWHGETHVMSVPATGGKPVFVTKGRKAFELGNISADGAQVALAAADTLHLPEIAIGRRDPKKPGGLRIKTLTAFNQPLLDELALSQPESVWLKSASGTKIHTWVMKPPGFKPGRKYPAVLEIHGGPHTQYGETFFHEMQVFAAAGYVVVFSNPRGSKGYGEYHCKAIKGDWGNADWEDMQAVTAFMQQQKFIDVKRMGVCGGSYGGYMTNWIIGHTNEFAAAVTDRCVSNFVSMVGSSDLPLIPDEYWKGNSWDDTEELWNQSPMKYMGNVKTPTLVVHSEGDLRCNVEQSEQVFAALKLRGIPTRFVRYPSTTSHGMSRKGPPDLRLHRLGQYLEWWERYLK